MGREERERVRTVDRVPALVVLARVFLGRGDVARVFVGHARHDDSFVFVGAHFIGNAPAGFDRDLERQTHDRVRTDPEHLDRDDARERPQRQDERLEPTAAEHPLLALRVRAREPALGEAGPERGEPVYHRGDVLFRAGDERGTDRGPARELDAVDAAIAARSTSRKPHASVTSSRSSDPSRS